MEDIRQACGISRGGLYHHFANKAAILDAIAGEDVERLAAGLMRHDCPPIELLLETGSIHIGNDPGILPALESVEEKTVYLSGFELASARRLGPLLGARLAGWVSPGFDPEHVAEMFLTINTHINRRVCLGDWNEARAAGFAATALKTIATVLRDASRLAPTIAALEERERAQ